MKCYWWQRMTTDIVHMGQRVVIDFEVCDDHEWNTQYYTGRSEMKYVPAYD